MFVELLFVVHKRAAVASSISQCIGTCGSDDVSSSRSPKCLGWYPPRSFTLQGQAKFAMKCRLGPVTSHTVVSLCCQVKNDKPRGAPCL